VVVPAVIAVLAAGRLVNGVQLSAGQWAALVGLLWVGTLPFALLGLGHGYLLSGQAAGLATFASSMGLAVVGGLWFPASMFPSWLAAIAKWTPTANYADLSWHVAFGQIPTLRSAAILAGWLLVFGLYARYAYRRGARKV
jgi:ABC-2 type transport system permease protein